MTDKYEGARANAQGWYESLREMVENLTVAREREENGEDHDGLDSDDAERAIHESVLSVEVRSDWYTLDNADTKPAEYRILLTTGGPGLQLTGTLNEHGEPETAELQMQDWGVPWHEWEPLLVSPAMSLDERIAAREGYREILLTFARCFYFGE